MGRSQRRVKVARPLPVTCPETHSQLRRLRPSWIEQFCVGCAIGFATDEMSVYIESKIVRRPLHPVGVVVLPPRRIKRMNSRVLGAGISRCHDLRLIAAILAEDFKVLFLPLRTWNFGPILPEEKSCHHSRAASGADTCFESAIFIGFPSNQLGTFPRFCLNDVRCKER